MTKRRPKNSDFEGEGVYAAAFVASVESVESAEKKCSPWVIDSGASSHMTKEKARYGEFSGILTSLKMLRWVMVVL